MVAETLKKNRNIIKSYYMKLVYVYFIFNNCNVCSNVIRCLLKLQTLDDPVLQLFPHWVFLVRYSRQAVLGTFLKICIDVWASVEINNKINRKLDFQRVLGDLILNFEPSENASLGSRTNIKVLPTKTCTSVSHILLENEL